MKTKITLFLALAAMAVISSCRKDEILAPETTGAGKGAAATSYVPDNSFKRVAYFPSYRDPAGVSAAKYEMLTHLFYAFITPDVNGNLNAVPNVSRFNSVIATARAAGCKVGVAVSGAANLATVCANTTKRTTLVNNLVNFVVSNNLDGLDMDWEFPRSNDGTGNSFTLLMSELSTALHAQNKFLSAAITPGVYSGAVRDGIQTPVFGYADFFNIMVYDGLGWDSGAPNQHASYNMAVTSLNYWIGTRGMPASKAVLGLPSYGLSNAASGSKSYRELRAAGAPSNADYFTISGVQWGYNGTATITSKVNLAQTSANGVMMWEFYGDTNGTDALWQAITNALPPITGTFDDFAGGVGRYTRQPTYSGSTVGLATTSTATHYVSGSSTHLKLTLNDNTSSTANWFVRLLSGDGLPANNVATSKTGQLYFWLKTSNAQAGAQARIWVDDSDGTEQSAPISIINDGAWHRYSFNLATWSGVGAAGGNGLITAPTVTLDAIILSQPNTSTQWVAYIDDVGN